MNVLYFNLFIWSFDFVLSSYSKNIHFRKLDSHWNNYCSVSNIINTDINGILGYPLDLFDSDNLISVASEKIFNCSSSEGDRTAPRTIHQCSSDTNCPLAKQNLIDANPDYLNTWYPKHSLCDMRHAIQDEGREINVVILGGSVTGGAACWGCCCNIDFDEKCKAFFLMERNRYCLIDHGRLDGTENHDYDIGTSCTWSAYLNRWLKSLSLGKVNYINLASGGMNSHYMSQRIVSDLENSKVSKFTKSDIIFIDYSVNDALSNCNGEASTLDLCENGLDLLIQELFSYSLPQEWPTVILLEMYPTDSYLEIYRKVASKYKLPIWSYHDMIWSNYSYTPNMQNFIEYLRFKKNINFGHQHPMWFVQLYYADLIGSLLIQEFHACAIADLNSTTAPRSRDQSEMSFRPSKELLDVTCSMEDLHSLDIDARRIFENKTVIGTFQSHPITSWKVIEDHKMKFGFIDSIMSTETVSCSLNDKYDSSLTFLFESDKTFDHSMIISIDYFRTYHNAGVVDVFLCDSYFTTLDALWDNYKEYHFSYNEIFSYYYNATNPSPKYCQSDSMKSISFKRICKSQTPTFTADGKDPRAFHKFKLGGVKICVSQEQ